MTTCGTCTLRALLLVYTKVSLHLFACLGTVCIQNKQNKTTKKKKTKQKTIKPQENLFVLDIEYGVCANEN